ncbi:MAG: arsenic ABC transporter [Methanomassiliicoccaceae archaeon]|jgi:Na+/H+ antiporter NhaD/arsenite permease-like protein|nr:arsenic ABC transporter [Methanomassiliicoccaceae archaeon]
MVLDTILITAAVFIFTYALISVANLPRIRISRGLAAAIGGILVLILGIVSVADVPDLINIHVIFLLIGMMMLVAGLEFSGFFRIISDMLIKRSGSKVRMLAYVMIICAVLSAIALNDAIVLMFTPIVIRCCRNTKSNPIPYLIGVMFSANIGSLATPVGNPQNAYIASEAGISFIDFVIHAVPISLICLPIAFFFIYMIFRKNLTSDMPAPAGKDVPVDRPRLWATVSITVGAMIGFALSDAIGIDIYVIALAAGILALLVVMSKSPKNIVWVAKKVDWMIIVFFIGLFILMGAVVTSGLLDEMASVFPGFGDGRTPSVLSVTAFSAVLSNIVSNVPAVVLIGGLLPEGNMMLWMTLAASSTLAGNATLVASAANVIVAERSENDGISFNFWKFAAIGVPVTIVTLFIAAGIMMLIF